MSIYFLLIIALIFGFVIMKLFYENKKQKIKLNKIQDQIAKIEESVKDNNKHIDITANTVSSESVNSTNSESLYKIEIQKSDKNIKARDRKKKIYPRNNPQEPLIDKGTSPKTPSRNSFLHGADDFGVMKKGVVLDDKSYTYDQKEDSDFEII